MTPGPMNHNTAARWIPPIPKNSISSAMTDAKRMLTNRDNDARKGNHGLHTLPGEYCRTGEPEGGKYR